MKKAFVYKLTFDRAGATNYVWYFIKPPTTSLVLEAVSVDYLTDLQTLNPSDTERAAGRRNWHDRMVEEITKCGVPEVGPSLGVTSRSVNDPLHGQTEITVEKLEAFV
jgi:hypothetical protein